MLRCRLLRVSSLVSISFVFLSQCRSPDPIETKGFAIIGRDGKAIVPEAPGPITIDIFTGLADKAERIIFRGQEGKRGYFYHINAQNIETLLKPQFQYDGKPIPDELPFIMGYSSNTRLAGTVAIMGYFPFSTSKGERFTHAEFDYLNLGSGLKDTPIKLCEGSNRCYATIDWQKQPPTLTMNYISSRIDSVIFRTYIGLNFQISALAKNGPGNIPSMFVTNVSPPASTTGLKDKDAVVSVNGVEFLRKNFASAEATFINLDKALNGQEIEIVYLEASPVQYISDADMQKMMANKQFKTVRIKR